jgi:hypothetical protein
LNILTKIKIRNRNKIIIKETTTEATKRMKKNICNKIKKLFWSYRVVKKIS